MHIEPGVVDGAKIVLSYATAAASFGLAGKMALDTIRKDGGVVSLAARSVATTALVFTFFEILPHHPVGVSEVHLILGSTLLSDLRRRCRPRSAWRSACSSRACSSRPSTCRNTA
jgi:hypothetical protein